MGKNINQIATEATTIEDDDKFYLGRSPYGATDDRYVYGSTLKIASGTNGQVNGVAASVQASFDTVHSYTISADDLAVGTEIVYKAKWKVAASNPTPETAYYRMQLMLGATPYDFDLEQPQVSDEGESTIGYINAIFQLTSIDAATYIGGEYQISLYNPGDTSFPTYSNTQFIQEEFDVGSDSFEVMSYIESQSSDVTIRIVSSSLNLTGAQ